MAPDIGVDPLGQYAKAGDTPDPLRAPEPSTASVPGYLPQHEMNIVTVTGHKLTEERLLRHIEGLFDGAHDKRWLAIARTHFEQGFMALNRAVFKPGRVKLPEDTMGQSGTASGLPEDTTEASD